VVVIRVVLPVPLRTLAGVGREVQLEVAEPATMDGVLGALEAEYPKLCGTIRDHVTHERRPFIRYFACQQDLSHQSTAEPLPGAVVTGAEPILVIGAMAGG
jgi:hypothetical protein